MVGYYRFFAALSYENIQVWGKGVLFLGFFPFLLSLFSFRVPLSPNFQKRTVKTICSNWKFSFSKVVNIISQSEIFPFEFRIETQNKQHCQWRQRWWWNEKSIISFWWLFTHSFLLPSRMFLLFRWAYNNIDILVVWQIYVLMKKRSRCFDFWPDHPSRLRFYEAERRQEN